MLLTKARLQGQRCKTDTNLLAQKYKYWHSAPLSSAQYSRVDAHLCSVCLLYWYKSTNTDTAQHAKCSTLSRRCSSLLSLLALLAQKYQFWHSAPLSSAQHSRVDAHLCNRRLERRKLLHRYSIDLLYFTCFTIRSTLTKVLTKPLCCELYRYATS